MVPSNTPFLQILECPKNNLKMTRNYKRVHSEEFIFTIIIYICRVLVALRTKSTKAMDRVICMSSTECEARFASNTASINSSGRPASK